MTVAARLRSRSRSRIAACGQYRTNRVQSPGM